jgi:hypothetical protein
MDVVEGEFLRFAGPSGRMDSSAQWCVRRLVRAYAMDGAVSIAGVGVCREGWVDGLQATAIVLEADAKALHICWVRRTLRDRASLRRIFKPPPPPRWLVQRVLSAYRVEGVSFEDVLDWVDATHGRHALAQGGLLDDVDTLRRLSEDVDAHVLGREGRAAGRALRRAAALCARALVRRRDMRVVSLAAGASGGAWSAERRRGVWLSALTFASESRHAASLASRLASLRVHSLASAVHVRGGMRAPRPAGLGGAREHGEGLRHSALCAALTRAWRAAAGGGAPEDEEAAPGSVSVAAERTDLSPTEAAERAVPFELELWMSPFRAAEVGAEAFASFSDTVSALRELALSPQFPDVCGDGVVSSLEDAKSYHWLRDRAALAAPGAASGTTRAGPGGPWRGVGRWALLERTDGVRLSWLLRQCGPLRETRPLFRHVARQVLAALAAVETQCSHDIRVPASLQLPARRAFGGSAAAAASHERPVPTPLPEGLRSLAAAGCLGCENVFLSDRGLGVVLGDIPWAASISPDAPDALARCERRAAMLRRSLARVLLQLLHHHADADGPPAEDQDATPVYVEHELRRAAAAVVHVDEGGGGAALWLSGGPWTVVQDDAPPSADTAVRVLPHVPLSTPVPTRLRDPDAEPDADAAPDEGGRDGEEDAAAAWTTSTFIPVSGLRPGAATLLLYRAPTPPASASASATATATATSTSPVPDLVVSVCVHRRGASASLAAVLNTCRGDVPPPRPAGRAVDERAQVAAAAAAVIGDELGWGLEDALHRRRRTYDDDAGDGDDHQARHGDDEDDEDESDDGSEDPADTITLTELLGHPLFAPAAGADGEEDLDAVAADWEALVSRGRAQKLALQVLHSGAGAQEDDMHLQTA